MKQPSGMIETVSEGGLQKVHDNKAAPKIRLVFELLLEIRTAVLFFGSYGNSKERETER